MANATWGDWEVRDSIAAAMDAAWRVSGVLKQRILKRWDLPFDKNGILDLSGLVSTVDLGVRGNKKVHGWVITRTGSEARLLTPNKWEMTWTYGIYGFMQLTPNTDALNSDREFNSEIDLLVKYMLKPDALIIPATCPPLRVSGDALSFAPENINIIPIGERVCHTAVGKLAVNFIQVI
jgi:hypothetical protein